MIPKNAKRTQTEIGAPDLESPAADRRPWAARAPAAKAMATPYAAALLPRQRSSAIGQP
jgi:hypothetical protein